MAPASGYWQDLTTEDFAGLDPERAVALLPVAAVEQHGPHLPLGTDAMIGQAVVARALARSGRDGAVLLVLPGLAVGDSLEHAAFPGTLCARPETLIDLWTGIGAHVARAGVRKLVLFNSHGGQPQLVDIVAQRLRAEHRMLVARVTSFQLGLPDGLLDAPELRHGLHAGALETSLMLHLHPDLVRADRVADFPSRGVALAARHDRLRAEPAEPGTVGFAWAAQDLNPAGATGNATAASAELGRAALDHMADGLARIVADLAAFPLSELGDGPTAG